MTDGLTTDATTKNGETDGKTDGTDPGTDDTTDGVEDGGVDGAVDGSEPPQEFKPLPPPEGAKRFSPDADVWLDAEQKVVLIDGEICLREGPLELLVCEIDTKAHESVIKVKAKPSMVHATLLLAGAENGSPVSFEPEYRPASGTEIEIRVHWVDQDGKAHEVDARQLVRNVANRKSLKYPWVFAGSAFDKDPETGDQIYLADSYADFICVSNFSTATLDLPVESTADNADLMFEAFTENIPPIGTKVRVKLIPKLKEISPESEDENESAPE